VFVKNKLLAQVRYDNRTFAYRVIGIMLISTNSHPVAACCPVQYHGLTTHNRGRELVCLHKDRSESSHNNLTKLTDSCHIVTSQKESVTFYNAHVTEQALSFFKSYLKLSKAHMTHVVLEGNLNLY
jgi:hypothetical protein